MSARIRSTILAAACALAALAPAAARAASTPDDPAPPALRLPAPQERTLPNGLRVVVFRAARGPIVQMQLLVPAGAASEDDSLPGIATLVAEMLRAGTASRSPEQFDGELAQLGATFGTVTTRDYTLLACGASTSAFENTMELMSDAVVNPIFGGDDFDRSRTNAIASIAGGGRSLSDVADEKLLAAAFAPHPYAHPIIDNGQVLLAAPRNAVLEFHRDHWRPDHAVLAIAGDIEPQRAFAAATDWFGRWVGRSAPARSRPAPHPRGGVRLVDVPDAPGAEIRVAVPGPGLGDPTHPAWVVLQTALTQRLANEGIGVSMTLAREASLLVLSTRAPIEQTVARVRRCKAVLEAIATAPPGGRDLDAARHWAAQAQPLALETLGGFLSAWQADDDAGLPADALARAPEQLRAADPASIASHFATPPVVLVVGPAKSLRAHLDSLGAVEVKPLLEARRIAGEVAPTPQQLRRGSLAVAAAVKAHGGTAPMAAMTSLVMEGEITEFLGGQGLESQFSLVRQLPDRMSMATRADKVEARQVVVGSEGWELVHKDSTSSAMLDSSRVRVLQGTLHSDLVQELLAASAPAAHARWRGTGARAGHTFDLVEFDHPVLGRQQLNIDTVTHRVLGIDGGLLPDGRWLERRNLSDFRTVNGVLLPFIDENTVGGQRMSRLAARKAAVNLAVDPRLFEKPASLRPKP